MNRRILWGLSLGSLALAVLEAPRAMQVVQSDWGGPYRAEMTADAPLPEGLFEVVRVAFDTTIVVTERGG